MIRFIVSIIVVLALLCPMLSAQTPPSHALKPQGEPAAELTLVEQGQAKVAIVLRDGASPPEQKAAEDLRHWVKEMTGSELPASGDAKIRIVTDESLPPEGYRIAVEGKDLVLAGAPGRGVVNAVYALLEEDLGCRWYNRAGDSVKLPKSKTLIVAPVAREYAPKLMLRDPFYHASFDGTWSLRNRTNAPDAKVPQEHGGHVDYGGLFVHTHAHLLPVNPHFKEHPEYFAARADGSRHTAQICATHDDVVRIVTENVLKVLAEKPHTEIVSVSKNDNTEVCRCERCAKLRADEGGSDMANQLYLVNRVAEAVEKKHPDVWIDTLAYLETIGVPKTVRPRKNVVIRLCNDSVGAWSRPFTPARQLPVAKIMEQWSAVHDRFSIWDYNVNFSHYLAPMPNVDVIADNLRFWTDHGAIGVLTQGGYQSTSERDELRAWVIAKLMWDPSRDEAALVRDFIEGHYGPAAAPTMLEYEALLARARQEHAEEMDRPPGGIRYPMTLKFLSEQFLAQATELFAQAREAAAGDATVIQRIERAELPILYVKLTRGPVTADTLDRFERIAQREKVDWLVEGGQRLGPQLEAWRKQVK